MVPSGKYITTGGVIYSGVGNFYLAVVQVVLLFGSESWDISESITRAVELNHVGFLRHIVGKRAQRTTDSTWDTPAAKEVLRATDMQIVYTYIGIR